MRRYGSTFAPGLSCAFYVLDCLLKLIRFNLRIVGRKSKRQCCFREFYGTHARNSLRKIGDRITTIVVSVGGFPFAIRDG